MPAPRKYSDGLRERAVRLVFESKRPIAHVAADLGVHKEALRSWVRQAERDSGGRQDGLTSAERDELSRLRGEVKQLRKANEILKAASVFFALRARPDPSEVSAFIDERRGDFGVELICATLEVSASAYYQRATGRRSARAVEDERLLAVIRKTHIANYEAYGSRRVWKALLRAGERVGRGHVERLMASNGICGAKRRGKPRTTTIAGADAVASPDLDRDFTATAPNRTWVADFTYLRCWEGVVFFSFVLDVYSRRLVGWQLAGHMRTELVQDALDMAVAARNVDPGGVLVHHSDRGSQYTSAQFTGALADHGLLASLGSVGDAYDNAMAESFVDTFKTELVADRPWRTRSELELAIVEWVGWHNHHRLHSSLGAIAPSEFEAPHDYTMNGTVDLSSSFDLISSD